MSTTSAPTPSLLRLCFVTLTVLLERWRSDGTEVIRLRLVSLRNTAAARVNVCPALAHLVSTLRVSPT